jgi:hypothetical protein
MGKRTREEFEDEDERPSIRERLGWKGQFCEECGGQEAVTEWFGLLLCGNCLEKELKNNHPISRPTIVRKTNGSPIGAATGNTDSGSCCWKFLHGARSSRRHAPRVRPR